MEDPSLLRSCNSFSPPFHSYFASDMAQLTPIILGLFGAMFNDLVCCFVSLSSLGRLGGLNVLGSNASVGIDIGATFSKLAGDMDLFFDVEPTLLRCFPVVSSKRVAGSLPLDWVLQIVEQILHIVGLSCEGFEEELVALFAAIEAGQSKQALTSCSIFGKKSSRESRWLVCSINYDANSGNASPERVKGRVASDFL